MDWLISSAMAQQAGASAQPGLFAQLFPLIALIVLFYFMLIRPQMKRNKEHKAMTSGLAKGDEVITSGGLAGRVTDVGEVYMTVEIAEGVEVKIQKVSLSSVLPKGTLKQL